MMMLTVVAGGRIHVAFISRVFRASKNCKATQCGIGLQLVELSLWLKWHCVGKVLSSAHCKLSGMIFCKWWWW